MSNRILVVETSNEQFGHWGDARHGLDAQLAALGVEGGAEIERIITPADLLEVASEVKNAKTYRPGR